MPENTPFILWALIVHISRSQSLKITYIFLSVRCANAFYFGAYGYFYQLFIFVYCLDLIVQIHWFTNGHQKLMKFRVIADTFVLVHWTILSQVTQLWREKPWQNCLSYDPISSIKDKNSVQKMQFLRSSENEFRKLDKIGVRRRTSGNKLLSFLKWMVEGRFLGNWEEDAIIDINVFFLFICVIHSLYFSFYNLFGSLGSCIFK